jgi:hypothetical protein
MKVFDQGDGFADGLAVGSTEALDRSFEVLDETRIALAVSFA